ncbi:MAG: uroporphyrinogen decarboxylase family protein, partial [Anaerolineae bacterium]
MTAQVPPPHNESRARPVPGTGRARVLAALDHREPDRVPYDLGSTQVTGIHAIAYRHLRRILGLPDADLIEHLGVDIRGLFPLNSHSPALVEAEERGDYWLYHDEWGITHRRPRPDGLYYSVYQVPLPGPGLTAGDIEAHDWPDVADPARIAGLCAQAEAYRAAGYAVVLKAPFAGLFEMAQRIVGMETLLVTMATDEALAGALFDKLLELRLAFWEMALPELGPVVDVVAEFDDYGTQTSQLISPRMFRRQLKPRLKVLFARFAALAPGAHRFFHSCGNVRPLIPDFIEIGVQVLNPIHVRAEGMAP